MTLAVKILLTQLLVTQPLTRRQIRAQIKNSGLSSLFLVLLAAGTSACSPAQPPAQILTFSGPMMGTEYSISVVSRSPQPPVSPDAAQLPELEQAMIDAMQSVNASMSTYIADSELNRLNRTPQDQRFRMSQQLSEVMFEAQRISHWSDGALDVTLGPVIDLWGFGPQGGIAKQPSPAELDKLRASVGYQLLCIDRDQIVKRAADINISLSAIAKGYAVDQVAELLLSRGEQNFLINIGGELRAAGHKPDGGVWRVGIEKPQLFGEVQQVVNLRDASVASSGDYRNFHLIDGRQYSHTIDPGTLAPVFHSLAAVSVIEASAMTADGLATALMVMGEDAAWEFVQQHDLAAFLIVRKPQPGQYTIKISDAFRRYLP